MATTKIPNWARKVQAAYRQKFRIGDIVRLKSCKQLGVVVGVTDYRGDIGEETVEELQPTDVGYTIWFANGPSAWHGEDRLTLVERAPEWLN